MGAVPGVEARREAGSEGDAGPEIDEGSLRRLFEDDAPGVGVRRRRVHRDQRWACFGAALRHRTRIRRRAQSAHDNREAQLFHMHSRDAMHAWRPAKGAGARPDGSSLSVFTPGATRTQATGCAASCRRARARRGGPALSKALGWRQRLYDSQVSRLRWLSRGGCPAAGWGVCGQCPCQKQ